MVKPKKKWQFAIGTTSRVPNSRGLHYLIADFDDGPELPIGDIFELCEKEWRQTMSPASKTDARFFTELDNPTIIIQKTRHGYHVYTNAIFTFDELVVRLEMLGADQAWIEIGKQRGYYFLADKTFIDFPWTVEHMSIYHGKEKTHNT